MTQSRTRAAPSAGRLIERVSFQRRDDLDDGAGNTVGAWTPVFERSAQFVMRPGSEEFTAARLEGRQPVTIIVRFDSQTSAVDGSWRIVDVRSGKTYAVRSGEDMDRRRQWMSFVCEGGSLE